MITWLLHYWFGYLRIQLHGYSPERFLNLCSANEIEMWDLQNQNDGYEFYMTVKGYRKIKPFVKKSKVKLRILKKFGLPFFLYRNKKRKLFFTGIACFFLILYLMSLFVWDIEFEGNHTYTYDTLIDFFDTQGIRYGMQKKKVDCDRIEADMRTEFSEITWVSARISGTRLLVKIKESEALSNIPVKDTVPCDIVAARSGTITHMVVRQGVPQVKIGDLVESGQVLVSGVLTVTNDAEEVVNTHYVRSDADIYAQTEYDYTKSFLRLHEVTVETGKERNGRYLKFFQYSVMMILPRPEGTCWKLVMEEEQLKLFENFYLPIYIGKIDGKEYITYERFYTEDEQNILVQTIHENFKKKLLEKGVQILENSVKILNNESNCQVVGHIVSEELIGKTESITKPEGTTDFNERSGNHN